MTPADTSGPEGETPSALSNPVPEFSLRYFIDWHDALVWEGLPTELRGLQKAVYIGFLVAGGMAYGIAGDSLPGWLGQIPEILQMLVVVAAMHGLWMIYYRLLQRHCARKRLPRRVYCVFEDWGDHVYIHTELDEVSLSTDLCRQTVVTRTHLFIDFAELLVIVPITAFDTPAQMLAFVEKWQRLADGASD